MDLKSFQPKKPLAEKLKLAHNTCTFYTNLVNQNVQITSNSLFNINAQQQAFKRAQHRTSERFLHQEAASLLLERLQVLRTPPQHILLKGDLFQVLGPMLEGAFPSANLAYDSAKNCDVVIDFMALHQIEDVPLRLRQTYEILRPGGVYQAVFLGGDTLQELRQALLESELELTRGAQARVHPMITLNTALDLLRSTGFELPIADHHSFTALYSSLKSLVSDLRDHGETCTLNSRTTHLARRALFALTDAKLRNCSGVQPFSITYDLIFLNGWRASRTI